MLKLILGKHQMANRDKVLACLTEDIKAGKGNRILMVPELISHDMERRLCASAGDTTSRYAQVVTFTRLARRVAEYMHIPLAPTLDKGGRVVAMAAACRQMHSKLKAYASVETKPEFLTGLLDAVDEFKRCCITPADLKEAARQTQGAFAQKLEELSLVLEAYDGICAQGKRDPRDQMSWLLGQMAEGDFAASHVFYIDGFPDLTRQHMAILEHLIRYSPSVTVSLNTDAPGSGAFAFEKAGDTAQSLLRFAKNANVPVQVEYVDGPQDGFSKMRGQLFQGQLSYDPELKARLFLVKADSIYAECSYAASRVLELVRGGSRYRDISIVCADMPGYRSVLDMTFRRAGIPLYAAGTEGILQKPVISTVLAAMDAALDDMDRESVLRYLKSALSPISPEDCDKLEHYTMLWGITGSKWQTQWQNHPDGLVSEWKESAVRRLEELNVLRERALTPLFALRGAFREARDLSQQTRALFAFLEDISLADRLRVLADSMDRDGDGRNAQILNQLWEILLSALEQMHDVLGETVWDSQSFVRLFTLLLSQYDVGTIPPVLDAVMAGPVSAMRCHQVRHLLVLGVEEGRLPGYCGASGILSDQERDALRRLGIPLTGGSLEGLQAEFAEIYGVFSCPSESICLCTSGAQPSYLYRRMEKMGASLWEITPDVSILTSDADAAAFVAAFGDKDAAIELGIGDAYADILARRDHVPGRVSFGNIQKLYGDTLRLSASQVDRQAECRFKYFLRYGLRAQEYKEATIDPAEFGTYVHAVLEESAREIKEMGGFHQVSLEQTMEIARKHSDNYAKKHFSQLDSERLTYLFNRNIRELEMIVEELWQELHESLFEPVDFELKFDVDGRMPPITIQGGKMQAMLRGLVDRVDAWHVGNINYYRVVDYKTGIKDFDYCDIRNGIGLQMLLYLFALQQDNEILGTHPVAAGVQYFPARLPLLTAAGKLTDEEAKEVRNANWKRSGLLLGETDVLRAMQPEGTPWRISCKVNKDGEFVGDLADRDQLKLLKRYVFHLLDAMVDEIASGDVRPNPYTRGDHGACSYCPYKSVCHYIHVPDRRNFRAITAEEFWNEIEEEVRRHG